MIARQQEIGLSVFQTNHSDVDDDAVGERLLSLSLLCAICMYNPIICQDWLGTNIGKDGETGGRFLQDCITMAEMTAKYHGFLGPRCGVKPIQ
jgi:hypothetical protein